ncbi:MAG: hypothetical protein OEM78_01740 [Gammaproteobacteria bacterium]|nr:hypothetical protein [Gammaproteobacteria bacterium]
MAAAAVKLRLEEPSRILFAHSPLGAFVFTLIALGFTWGCWRFVPAEEGIVRWIFVGFCLLFVLAGVFGIFWRYELDIDLGRRRIRIRRGFWPSPQTSDHGLDEADGVWLTMDYRSSGSKSKRKVPWWFVSLKFPGEKKGTRIFVTRNETEGFAKWEHYAERLRLDAVDATGDEPQRRSWEALDEKLVSSEREDRPVRAPTPPAGTVIRTRSNRGWKEVLLPAPGFNGGLVFLVLFGGAFTALGITALLAVLGVIDMQVQGSEVAMAIVPPVFVLVGLGVIWLGIIDSYKETIIGVVSGELFIERLAFGRRSGRRAIPLADIESVSVAGDVRSRHRTGVNVDIGGVRLGKKKYRDREDEIVVRADQKILRFGSSLPEEDRTWLADACHYAVVEGRFP